MLEPRYKICRHCGNIVSVIHDSGVPIICCGEPMQELKAGSVDASHEKHVPVITANGGTVTVQIGSVEHPMIDAHYIQWIVLVSAQGRQYKALKPGEAPKAVFALGADDRAVAAYAYCNLHGLWKAEA